MVRYSEYKDSGVEWIGEIPSHWNIVDFRRCVSLKQGLQIAQDKRFETPGKNRHVYITVKYINSNKEDIDTEYIEKPYKSVLCDKEDVLLARTGATGKVITDVEGVFHNNFFKIIYDKQKITKEYLVYYLKQETIQNYLKLIAGTTTIPDLNHGAFLSTKVVLPSILEQNKICNYLDRKILQIQILISKKEELIETLKASRTKLISETVNKGLDKDAPMKDSGVEWIGEIPSHWEVKKLKFVTSLNNIKLDNSKFSKYIGLEHVEQFSGKLLAYGEPSELDSKINSVFYKDNILFGKLRPYLAKCIVAETDGVCSDEFLVLKSHYITPQLLKYIMLNKLFIELVNSSTYGAKMPRASWDFIGNIEVSYPDINEQIELVKYLDEKTSKIDNLVKAIEKQIETLKKAKQKLITEVVTGKRDVTNL